MTDLTFYKTLVFDCDGVVLNSNKIKTRAFYDVASIYGHKVAKEFKDYHCENGGISRYAKFEYLITDILNAKLEQQLLQSLLDDFAHKVKQALITCEVAKGLETLRQKTKLANWLIVSGGDQSELREVFADRRLDKYFDGGIFGSPDNKDAILKRELNSKNITKPAIFIGDSKYDYEVAQLSGLDFIFLTGWTDVEDFSSWCDEKSISTSLNIESLQSGYFDC
jgi:phosphoglycolate phosphatase-like HAD superfamily hydrolase